MKTKWIKKSLCFLLCLGMATAAMAQSKTPSILDRVQNESDPELGELIRAAIEREQKLPSTKRKPPLELIRQVTLSYTQIKLFDQQIAEVSRRLKEVSGPAELRYELLLARTELEAKLMTEVANLRELMGIVPRHAFDQLPIETLSSWVILRVLDEGVYVLDTLQPFHNYRVRRRYKSSGLQSRDEALDYVREKLKDPNNFPIRIELFHTAEMSFAAKDLHGKVVSLAVEANCQMEADVSLTQIPKIGTGVSFFFIRDDTISTLHHYGPILRPDGGPEHLSTGVVEPNDLDQHILWRLLFPRNVPLKFRIEYDQKSNKLARQTAEKVRTIAKDLGIAEVVEVERILVEATPESDFLGRWQAITKGDIQTIDIQPTGVCVFGNSPGSKIKGGPSVPGRWFMTPKEIFMDIKDQREWYYIYCGQIDKQGHLVVDRGEIDIEGSFGKGWEKDSKMVFKKEY
ncbi:MAG: hypothetical protein GY845_11620 [Planctomycetes bacterium]|nr:hypothetical protein [Planctomycetota bacterium]